jgi:hypothetical protein
MVQIGSSVRSSQLINSIFYPATSYHDGTNFAAIPTYANAYSAIPSALIDNAHQGYATIAGVIPSCLNQDNNHSYLVIVGQANVTNMQCQLSIWTTSNGESLGHSGSGAAYFPFNTSTGVVQYLEVTGRFIPRGGSIVHAQVSYLPAGSYAATNMGLIGLLLTWVT